MAANMRLEIGAQTIELPFSESEFWSVVRPFVREDERAQENLNYASRNYGRQFNAGLMIGIALGYKAAKTAKELEADLLKDYADGVKAFIELGMKAAEDYDVLKAAQQQIRDSEKK